MEQYAAGIVLYNPDKKRLKENLDAICNQVECVYCYNNGLGNDRGLASLLSSYSNIRLIGTGENVGIAKALNELVIHAAEDGMDWILTLDQDSVACNNMITSLVSLTHEKKVAIICPLIEDVRRKNEEPVAKKNTIEDVNFCITSGSFMNIKRTLEIGGYDERLFIGLVDDEICYRIIKKGYRIIRNNSIVLDHELGNLTPSKYEKFYLKTGDIIHNEKIKKLSYKRAVSPMRLYYATRNMVYLNNKYSRENASWSSQKLLYNSISSLLRGKEKMVLIKSIIKGIKDGKRMDV